MTARDRTGELQVKFKMGDRVWFDNNPGLVMRGYPAYDHEGYSYEILWDTGTTTQNVWESDLFADDDEAETEILKTIKEKHPDAHVLYEGNRAIFRLGPGDPGVVFDAEPLWRPE